MLKFPPGKANGRAERTQAPILTEADRPAGSELGASGTRGHQIPISELAHADPAARDLGTRAWQLHIGWSPIQPPVAIGSGLTETPLGTTQKTPPQDRCAFPVAAAGGCGVAVAAPCKPPMCIPQRAAHGPVRAGRGARPHAAPVPPALRAPRPPSAGPPPCHHRPGSLCVRAEHRGRVIGPPARGASPFLARLMHMHEHRPRPAPSRAGVRGARWRRRLPPRRAGARALARASRACSLRAATALQPCQRARGWAHHEPWPCP